ncbi:N-acetyl sugar amidotransferase [Pyruvatibacter mobilis]|uniref:N-acetyl sugar amidotransferase n=1 Tax=Pyruvatibacter mobilis TaxID=1712261 RepID=A0A845Q765_9HYPH|nr:N-acetyl sugar amidotransferase [Pyruvatibacter mobilis]NBG94393.1 N-acetyl sugar amidotransferase [Pyruvatibacter mobilis]QJD76680.1 N-acetyl sugar amidotransferase [Pyruvatibacter mobilis]GGD02603.1 LPS biosynthesis protein WbpG [Pyruvatibacter mobilis]
MSDRPYQVCTRCIMDTTDAEITFDEHGVCNHCQYFETGLKPNWFPNDQGKKMLREMIDQVRREGKGKKYDCIIGLSGGVDSSYLAAKVAEWGLRPLAVHVDGGWNSELAVKNIEMMTEKLGLDLATYVVDWEEMRDLQLAFLRSNVANQDVPQDHAFFAALYNFAAKEGIKYVISGSNYATESILPVSWGYDPMDIKHVTSIHKIYGTRKLRKFPTVNFFKFHIYYPRILGMTVLRPLNLMHYNKDEAIEYLEKNYGWRYYGGKHYESRWTRFFQAHYLPTKFGYDKRRAHLSSLVVADAMSREQALQEMKKQLYTDNELAEDKAFVAKKLGITVGELEEFIAQPIKHYTDYPHNQDKVRQMEKVFAFYRHTAYQLKNRFHQVATRLKLAN